MKHGSIVDYVQRELDGSQSARLTCLRKRENKMTSVRRPRSNGSSDGRAPLAAARARRHNRSREKAAELEKNGAKARSIAETAKAAGASALSPTIGATRSRQEFSARSIKARSRRMGRTACSAARGRCRQANRAQFVASPCWVGPPRPRGSAQHVPAARRRHENEPLNALMGRSRSRPARSRRRGREAANTLNGCATRHGEASRGAQYGVDPKRSTRFTTLVSARLRLRQHIAKELYYQSLHTAWSRPRPHARGGLAENIPLPSLNVVRDKLLPLWRTRRESRLVRRRRHQARSAGSEN